MQFGINEAISLFNQQTNIVNDLWGLFQVVSVGLLSLAYGNNFLRDSVSTKIALGLVFFMFAGGNRTAISRSQEILEALAGSFGGESVRAFIEKPFLDVIPAIKAVEVEHLIFFHWLTSIAVVLLLFLPELISWFRDRGKAN